VIGATLLAATTVPVMIFVEFTHEEPMGNMSEKFDSATPVPGRTRDAAGGRSPAERIARLKEASAEAPFVNSLGMRFVAVPIYGAPADTAMPVLFATTEVTEGIYKLFIAAKPRPWPAVEFVQNAEHPAVNVTWDDAVAFCAWLTELERSTGDLPEGVRYRLPSDHEWSCAVGLGEQEQPEQSPKEKRGAIEKIFPWDGAWPPPPRVGNYADASAKKAGVATTSLAGYDDGFERTSPVETFAPNALGLYGLGDNVSEWCSDWFDPAKRTARTFRGASWADAEEVNLLSSFRAALEPTRRSAAGGFRCVLELPATAPSPPP
jgi:hypothetical protein